MNQVNQEAHGAQAISAPARGGFDPAGRVSAFLTGFAPRTLAYLVIAGVIGLLAQAATVTTFFIRGQIEGQMPTEARNDFGLASIGSGPAPLLVIRFSPQATSAEINNFLFSYKAEVVSGPRKGNFYDVRVVGTASKAEINAIVKQMQRQPEIVDLVAEKE